jgi:hypothetical protein
MPAEYEVAWNIFTELRKEILESQKIRAQIIGVKITFVGTSIGLIAANPDRISSVLLVIPAFAAMFFDLLIISYSFSINRIGYYTRNHLEKKIHTACRLPEDFILWQEFLYYNPRTRQLFSHYGNVGLTFLALVPAAIALFSPFRPWISLLLLTALLALFVFTLSASHAAWDFKHAEFTAANITSKPTDPTQARGADLP